MNPESRFDYVAIEGPLYPQLADHLIAHESFALLGPRAAGKRHVLDMVAELLFERGVPFLQVAFDAPGYLTTEKDVMERLLTQLCKSSQLNVPKTGWHSIGDFFDWLQNEAARLGRHISVLLGNFGRISETLAAQILTRIRGMHDLGLLAVGLCGEANVARLIHGEGSWYQCERFYVIQGMGDSVYAEFFDRMMKRLKLEIDEVEQFRDALFVKTGGDLRLLRHVLHAFAMQRRDTPIQVKDLPDSFLDFEEPRVWSFEAFGPVQRLAEALQKEDLLILRSLVVSQNPYVLPPSYSGPHAPPHPLELMGLVNRDTRGERISFPSSFVARFARFYFSEVRLGDLFARAGDWEGAFKSYAACPAPEKLMRPHSATDYAVVRQLVQSLCGEMHRQVAGAADYKSAVNSIQSLAERGCRFLLGHSHVSIWQSPHTLEWTPLRPEFNDPNAKAVLDQKASNVRSPMGEWVQCLRKEGVNFAIVEDAGRRRLAIVAADWGRVHLPQGTLELTEQLLRDFSIAWRHATNVLYTEHRLLEQKQLLDSTSAVSASLGQAVLDVEAALRQVGAKLLSNRAFARVAWLLKDPAKATLRFVSEQTGEDILRVFPDGMNIDIDSDVEHCAQNCFAEAIRTNTPFVLREPASRSLIPEVIRNGVHGVCLALGIRHTSGTIMGAIFLEQKRGITTTRDLKQDLVFLSLQVADLILQAQRADAQLQAIDGIGDPIAFVDVDGRLRYANAPAASLLNLGQDKKGRWLSENDAIDWESLPNDTPFKDKLLEAVSKDRINSLSIFHELNQGSATHWNATVFPIRSGLGYNIGYVIRLRNRTVIWKAFNALFQMGAASNITECLNKFFVGARDLTGKSAKMVRLYLVDDKDTKILRSNKAIGFKNKTRLARFDSGLIVLDPSECPEARKALDGPDLSPICWHWNPNGPDGSVSQTGKGLSYTVTNRGYLADELEKTPGEFWIDLPLVALGVKREPLGKITLSFDSIDELPNPDEFVYLAWFAQVAAKFLGGVVLHESRIESVERKTLATSAHNLATRTSALAGFIGAYDDIADDIALQLRRTKKNNLPAELGSMGKISESLCLLNKDFRSSLEGLDQVLMRMKHCLAGIASRETRHRKKLENLVQEASLVVARNAVIKITGSAIALIDPESVLMAFQELFEDSVAFYCGKRKPIIKVQIAYDKSDYVRVVYSDNGPGIPFSLKTKIFEPYFKTGKKRKGQSTGVGLYFVKNVCDAHNWSIREMGTPGKGAIFEITGKSGNSQQSTPR